MAITQETIREEELRGEDRIVDTASVGSVPGLRHLERIPQVGGAIPEARESGRARERDRFNKRALAAADVMSAAIALVLGGVVFASSGLAPAVAVLLPLIIGFSKAQGLYERDRHLIRKTTLDQAP